jgi:hypothetical protein
VRREPWFAPARRWPGRPVFPLPTAEIRQKEAHRRAKLIAPIAHKSFLVRALRYSTVSIRISFDSGIFRAVTVEKKGLSADRQRNFRLAIFGHESGAIAADSGLAPMRAAAAGSSVTILHTTVCPKPEAVRGYVAKPPRYDTQGTIAARGRTEPLRYNRPSPRSDESTSGVRWPTPDRPLRR